jgi:hypothetical protein
MSETGLWVWLFIVGCALWLLGLVFILAALIVQRGGR